MNGETNSYTFDVPTVGTVRIEAATMGDALLDLADKVGIKLVGAIERPLKKERPLLFVINGGIQS